VRERQSRRRVVRDLSRAIDSLSAERQDRNFFLPLLVLSWKSGPPRRLNQNFTNHVRCDTPDPELLTLRW
jgi:hypothetical protein